jgi:hypothetical protein
MYQLVHFIKNNPPSNPSQASVILVDFRSTTARVVKTVTPDEFRAEDSLGHAWLAAREHISNGVKKVYQATFGGFGNKEQFNVLGGYHSNGTVEFLPPFEDSCSHHDNWYTAQRRNIYNLDAEPKDRSGNS